MQHYLVQIIQQPKRLVTTIRECQADELKSLAPGPGENEVIPQPLPRGHVLSLLVPLEHPAEREFLRDAVRMAIQSLKA